VRFGVLPTSPLLSSVIGIEEGGIRLIIGTNQPQTPTMLATAAPAA
jgi:hypothetical protein